jgi:hypothetical protein
MKRQSWQVFAAALRGFLVLAVVVAVPATVLVLASPSLGAEEIVAAWGRPARPAAQFFSLGNFAVVGFLIIPLVAYLAAFVAYVGIRRWPYVVMTVLQLLVFLTVALGVV